MTRVTPFDLLTVRFGNGRTSTVEVTDVTDDSVYTVLYREDDRREQSTVYRLYHDGEVYRERWGTGRNAGEFLSSEHVVGATWEVR